MGPVVKAQDEDVVQNVIKAAITSVSKEAMEKTRGNGLKEEVTTDTGREVRLSGMRRL